ncbi:MAG: N,N-dimethylformamidase beta subunit family domain-containing protein [Acidimicrobiales bacterium]
MIAGYCWPQSGLGGQTIELAISADEPLCDVEVSRVGRDEHVLANFTGIPVSVQPVPDDAAAGGCGWSTTIDIEIDPGWTSGFYLVRMSTNSGSTAEAFFVVLASDPRRSILVLSTSTWAAYNDWGGPSFYTGGHVSSHKRPLPPGFLEKPDPHRFRVAKIAELQKEDVDAYFAQYSYWSCAAGWANWERLFVSWAENNGLEFDYATSLDLATDPKILEPYDLYLSVGHDEYWSASMRDTVESWADQGGFAAFFSGNTAFWQVRFDGDDLAMTGYKMEYEQDPVMGTPAQTSVSTMWSDPLTERPENEMTGVSFTRGGYAHCRAAPRGSGGYSVWRPDHWAFEGVALRPGDIVGAEPVVVGYECDGCELTLQDGLPAATGTGGTPANFEVLATAPARLWLTEDLPAALADSYVGELNWVARRLAGADTEENRARFANGAAVMGSYNRGHGEVLTVGCTDWAYGLEDPDIARITKNVFKRATDHGEDR